ncbi:hypothetical protein MIMGU_mgv1a003949mg [Erythranthe guttata]|uniref:FAD-binding PCMH-type domain-containing protein n=1 Tax=Erythranthe guttata TaxID=4155 RepID=A0A022PNJ6_ERYGU|nr:PREDICTED: tetrahydrocannabinolic acid synthase-like [Erythranthe guttata]EYU17882.1 hypothetical protein MIMGU_mgv1a003949mg [Erythranthe guttata]|eukprot:XP_012829114.1 PREDICTED: tetrahydrocannabinolic acid synthase-like [Erythranthe guttata]
MGSSNYNIILIFLCFSNLLRFIASSASGDDHNINYNEGGDFVECLTVQLESSNSATDDLIYTPNNSSSYASLLIAQNLRPGSTSPYDKPLIIFTPFYDYQIQSAIYCSKKLRIQIRVRSGGHDYEGLSHTSRDNPFVVVDMRNLRQISIDAEQKTAWVQVGATLGQLYHTLAQKSGTLAFTAGVCPTVGIGGHLSGGGYGMMSRRHSISADHIIDARIMNVDGQMLDRRSMGEDLFWAIRGGGGTSFGIVIAFKVNLITVPETVTVFNVTKTYEQNATQLVHRWQYIADKVDDNLLMRVFLRSVRSLTTGKRTVIASFTTLYLGGVEDLMPIMKEKFPELGLVEKDCTEMSWIQSVLYFAYIPNQPLDVLLNRTTPFTVYFKGKSDFATEPIPVDGLIGIFRFLREEDENMAEIQLSPYGGALNSFSESETPFPHRTGNIFMIDYGLSWDSPGKEEAEKHLNWMRRIYGYMAAYVSKSPRAAYFNYRDLDLGVNDYSSGNTIGSYDEAKVWGMKYFKNNFERLVRVKTKVDPSNFFRNEQSIPPFPLPPLYSS